MKSRHLYWLLAFGFIVVLFLSQKTYAATYQQTDDSTESSQYTWGNNPLQTFSGVHGNWQNLTLHFSNCTGNFQIYVRQWDTPPTNWDTPSPSATWHTTGRTCTNTLQISSTDEWNAGEGGAPSFDASKYYGMAYYASLKVKGSSNPNSYTGGVFYSGTSFGSDPNIADEYFVLTTANVNTFTLNSISNSSSSQISFTWQYQLEDAQLFQGYYTIFSDWDLYKCDPTCATKIGSNFGYSSHPNSNIATGTTAGFSLDNGTYQIKDFYLKYDSVGAGNITASTTKANSNEFTISFPTPYIPTISLPTSTIASTTPIQITCDPNDPWYSYSLCKIGVWLFIPSQSVLNQFSNLTADISQKPPIGYFTSIKNALSGFTSSTPAFTINVSSTDPVATNFFTPIRTGLIWILWLAFAFWLFHRFRHFNLTNP